MLEAILFASLFPVAYHIVLVIIRRRIKQNTELISITQLDKDLWKILSKYIRSKDADWKNEVACFTCGKRDDWRALDCGHYIAKATSGSFLKFYEKNLAPQCITCNRLKGGNYQEYKNRLIVKYGAKIIDELNALRQAPPLTVSDYQRMIIKYTALVKAQNSK